MSGGSLVSSQFPNRDRYRSCSGEGKGRIRKIYDSHVVLLDDSCCCLVGEQAKKGVKRGMYNGSRKALTTTKKTNGKKKGIWETGFDFCQSVHTGPWHFCCL
ncbi:hypothetical protein IscW_ISCW015308 [Ixodes scapularis]|uniref:Uncharacterized protein n=1 Tax=Ixodes scapularis TaxID=6945 RepID=B7QMN3_IXOSC|nr:hypothetical protein IscW_ISCW015308 [Ixodes scapularis]|eukprot:XP_002399941.1 hypothetical protein IscW_ISCW015308 [Ixodes scapularis]